MDTWQLLVGLPLLAVVTYVAWHHLTYGRRKYGIPESPFLGMVPAFMKHEHDLFDWLTEVLEKCPKLCCVGSVPGVTWFFTANPVHVQHILKDNFANYPKGDDLRDSTVDLLGHGIFTSDGEQWKQQRKMASYEFSTNSLRNLMLVSVKEEITDRLIPTLQWALTSGVPIDIHDVMLRFTFDNICRIGFGVDTKALSPDLPPVPFATSIDRATVLSSMRASVPTFYWKIMRFFRWGSEGEFFKEMTVVHAFVEEVINLRKKYLAAKPSNQGNGLSSPSSVDAPEKAIEGAEAPPPEGTSILENANRNLSLDRADLLSRMIALGEKDKGQVFSDGFLRDACINFLIAGRDTTAVTLSWLFWELTQHPDAEDKIVQELESIIDQREGEKEAPFSFDELKLMVYTQAAINESMRLHATVPVDQKVSENDDVMPDGTVIGKGWRISYHIYGMGRMKQIWGPDALEFRPDRWITEDGLLKVESPFKFVVFNAGPRLCLGRDMAYLQMKSVVSSVLRRYKLQLVPGHQVAYAISLTLLMKDGLLMTVVPRK